MDDVIDINPPKINSKKYFNIKFDSTSQPFLSSIYKNSYPNVVGMQIGDALYILESYGYDVNIISGFNGKVIKQELYDNDQVKTILLSVN